MFCYCLVPLLTFADVNYLLDVLTQKKQKLEAVSAIYNVLLLLVHCKSAVVE